MDDPAAERPAEQGVAQQLTAQPRAGPPRVAPIAGWWHTGVVLATLTTTLYEALRMQKIRAGMSTLPSHIVGYSRSSILEWAFLGFILLGVWLHSAPLATVMGPRWKSVREVFENFGTALAFWFGSVIVLLLVRTLLWRLPNGHAARFLLPHGRCETILWIVLSISAGICEEAIFRGYLQRQFLAMTQSTPAAIGMTSLAFGAVHAYQGLKGLITIGCLGLMLGVLAHRRGTVRIGMIAHAWQDAFAGLIGTLSRP
jgi:uncharacterized protein